MAQIEVQRFTMDNIQVLVDLHGDFRALDKELDIENEVRYVTNVYGGKQAGTYSIVYNYPDEAHAIDAMQKRMGNARYQELVQKLLDAGFELKERSLLYDFTPTT